MLDIGWSELLVIGVVALIVVGPKDLPVMFRTLGRFTAKARAMGREFQRAMDEAARETGVKETADDLRKMTSKKALGLDALDKAATKFEQWNPAKAAITPKGPATQALADKRAAEAAARTAAVKPAGEAAAATPSAPSAPVVSQATGPAASRIKAVRRTTAAADPAAKAAPTAAGKPAAAREPAPAGKPAAKPRKTKSES